MLLQTLCPLLLLTCIVHSRTPYHFDYQPTAGLLATVEQTPNLPAEYLTIPLYPGARTNTALATDQTGLVWLFGGKLSVASMGDVWSYDAVSATWTFRNPQKSGTNFDGELTPVAFPGARAGHVLLRTEGSYFPSGSTRFRLFGGTGYVVGGGGSGKLMDVWDYDTISQKWTYRSVASGSETWFDVGDSLVAPVRPCARTGFAAWMIENDLYVTSGSCDGSRANFRMWIFSDQKTSWTGLDLNPMSTYPATGPDRNYWKADGKFYIFGGFLCCPSYSNSLYRYTVDENLWERVFVPGGSTANIAAPPYWPGIHYGASSVVIPGSAIGSPNDIMMLHGGSGYSTDGGVTHEDLGDMWAVHPETDTTAPYELISLTLTDAEQAADAPGSYTGDMYPSARVSRMAVTGRTLVLFGGYDNNDYGDMWVMTLPCYAGAFGSLCDEFLCIDGMWTNESSVCNSTGRCEYPGGACVCDYPWKGDDCTEWGGECFGVPESLNGFVCSGNGQCISQDVCICETGWTQASCDEPKCDADLTTIEGACSYPNGTCVAPGVCQCEIGFGGVSCENPLCDEDCHGVLHGTCVETGVCICEDGYDGLACEKSRCGTLWSDEADVCSGSSQGTCIDQHCVCLTGFGGDNCEVGIGTGLSGGGALAGIVAEGVVVAILVVVVVVLLVVVVVLCVVGKKKGGKDKEMTSY